MAAADHLGLQFHIADNGLALADHPKHGLVGEMTWDPGSGELGSIETDPAFQRKGVATALWNKAHEHAAANAHVAAPVHSRHRTAEGNAWAKSVGGELPRLHKVTF